MAIRTIEQLLNKFGPGDSPRSADYVDLIDTLADDRNAVYFNGTAPLDTAANPIWFDTTNEVLFVYSNSEWIAAGGAPGNDGDSAYEIALANGFAGTQQQWLNSLVGASGTNGTNGTNGADSTVPGPTGPAGATGATGPAGPAGADSTVPGPQGSQGPSGVISVTSPITNSGTSTSANIGIDLSSYYTSSQVDTAIAAVVDAAPGTLNTLNELAAAINDDASYAATITTALGNKQDKISGVSDTEIGYLDGVTSAIQTQINSKAPTESPTFTGTVSGVTKAHVGLGNVDNTSDANKPVSTVQQTALDLKANLASPTLTSARLIGNTAIEQIFEDVTIVASAAAATINYDLLTNHAITLYTVNSSANWTLNVRGNSSTTLNSLMSIGQSLTVVFIATNGVTPYYQAGLQIDGQAVTPKWQGGTSPTAGNASSLDSYSVTIIKTANAQFNVLESQVRFA
jgi:hypothetical protein